MRLDLNLADVVKEKKDKNYTQEDVAFHSVLSASVGDLKTISDVEGQFLMKLIYGLTAGFEGEYGKTTIKQDGLWVDRGLVEFVEEKNLKDDDLVLIGFKNDGKPGCAVWFSETGQFALVNIQSN